jgi:uncharacterized protein YbjT (DUF2867 family)
MVMNLSPLHIVMLGATGAVGGQVVHTLAGFAQLERLTLLGRRAVEGLSRTSIVQHTVDVEDPHSYQSLINGHTTAICTLGVGQPSQMRKEEFVRIDKLAVLDFARACKVGGVRHFQLLGSVGANSRSRSFYLRTKGELEDALTALAFDRLSLFRPSMILTPTNRYGLSQAVTLAVWPVLQPLLIGKLRKFRGVKVEALGRAIAMNATTRGSGVEVLEWDAIRALRAENTGISRT